MLPEPDDGRRHVGLQAVSAAGELAADIRRRHPRHTALLAALPAHHLRPALQERLVVRLHAGGHVARVRAHVCDRHRCDPRDHSARLRGSHLRRRHHVHEPGDECCQRHQQPPPRRLAVQHGQRRAQGARARLTPFFCYGHHHSFHCFGAIVGLAVTKRLLVLLEGVRPWTRPTERVGGRRVVRGGAVEHGVAHAPRHRHRLPLAPLPPSDAAPKGGGAQASGAAPQPRRRLGDACAARFPRRLRHDPRRAANLPADGLPQDSRRQGVLGPRC
mmetsp:Transcript_4365/g.14116  ORF Transcript_4365/g.14116 Transcript_4365/m.14116 type:complete len:273 (+) Transcript_4365:1404-2222(+)